MDSKLAKYTIFLNSVENILQKYFDAQKEYIKCRPECSYCCESGSFPASELEFNYLKQGFKKLDKETKNLLRKKSLNLYKKRYSHLQQGGDIFDFEYKCLFLNRKKCLLYDYRPLICRVHGLMSYAFEDGSINPQKVNMPSCTPIGLNYANVFDEKSKTVSLEKAKNLNMKVPPKIYSINYSKLLDELKEINLDYGDIRMLFEWILLDIPNYQEFIDKIKKSVDAPNK